MSVLGVQARKLSPNAEALLMRQSGRVSTMMKSYGDTSLVEVDKVKVFIDMNNEDAIEAVERCGGRVFLTFGETATAEVPVNALRLISEHPSVSYVEMGSPVHLCMDQARQQSGIDIIHANTNGQLPQAYTGEGVVVGVIDTGLEYDHIAFRTSDGKGSRVKRVWNQRGFGSAPEKFGYGVELTTIEEMRAAKFDDNTEYHGTHTTSIAAGGDRLSKYYGVAPDADIVFVSFGQSSVDIPNAVRYIQDYAESVGKPCVINMSLGSHLGPHNGSSTLDRFFDSVSGPGTILVGAAGNEGANKMHVGKTFTADNNTLKTILGVPSTSSKNTVVDVWGRECTPITVSVVLTDSKGKIVESYSVKSTDSSEFSRSFSDSGVNAYFAMVPAGGSEDEAPNVYLEFYISSMNDARRIGIIVEGEEGQEVNMWNLAGYDFVNSGFRGWTAGDNTHTVGEIGGTSESVISVGSYNSRFTFPMWVDPGNLYVNQSYGPEVLPLGEVSFFSSNGPTADGRIKPDVSAPGALVIAGFNKYMVETSILSNLNERVFDADNNDYYYYWNIGTSMATPVVTGSVALMLQAKPDLTVDEVLDALAHSSTKDSYTGDELNNKAGHGKLNTYGALSYILAQSAGVGSITDDASKTAEKVWFDSLNRNIGVSTGNNSDILVYTMLGSMVGRYSVAAGIDSIDCSGWTPGVYVVKFVASGNALKVVVN